ncbi:uncharacterized protein [Panulirus ornatus]|uniref:uncharacterized protein n=1 Tax=Panulirus ornatus TaxID=150431 RepID=UPI003A8C4717
MLRLILCLCLVAAVYTQQTTRGYGGGDDTGLPIIAPPETLSPVAQQRLSTAQLRQQSRVQQLLTFRQRQQARRLREEARRRQERRRQQEFERQRLLALRQQQTDLQLQRAQVHQAHVVGPYIPILDDHREGPYQDGTYYFTYATGNGIVREERGTPTGPDTLEVTGSYSYTAPNGEVISMEYIADEYGYRAFPLRSDR